MYCCLWNMKSNRYYECPGRQPCGLLRRQYPYPIRCQYSVWFTVPDWWLEHGLPTTQWWNKYNNWCKASKLIAPALTTIWNQIFKMGSWKNNNPAMHNCLFLVINVLLLSILLFQSIIWYSSWMKEIGKACELKQAWIFTCKDLKMLRK